MLKANFLKTITSPASPALVLTGYWTLVSQDTTLLRCIWIALPNHRTVEPQLTSTFTRLSKQQDQEKFQEKYLSLFWRNIHCRERRKTEEYFSLEVTYSNNNSIIESVEFFKPSFRRNLQNLLEITSESELQNFYFGMHKKELVLLFCVVVC